MVKAHGQKKTDTQSAPFKPVHTTSIQHHALFGTRYVKEHMMVDDSWKYEDVTEEYELITALLKRNLSFENFEKHNRYKQLYKTNKKLRQQVHVGRNSLQMARGGEVQKQIRLILGNHKDMQRLYAKMSSEEVLENITQRTFTMRKERDRIRSQLKRMGDEMEVKKLELGHLETHKDFYEEMEQQELIAHHELLKLLQNSQARLNSLQIINNVYKKMVQVLQHAEKFHEPILDSLAKDVEDQQTFINHIIHIGRPAVERLNELKRERVLVEDLHRKERQSKGSWLSEMHRISVDAIRASTGLVKLNRSGWKRHHVRETTSMKQLRNELMILEKKIKLVQEATLCSRPLVIYDTFIQQSHHNLQLQKLIALQQMKNLDLKDRTQYSSLKKQSILDDFSSLEEKRMKYIDLLKQQIREERHKESQLRSSIRKNSKTSLVLRGFLWNAFDILRNVELPHSYKLKGRVYKNSYMRLPLLKFELHDMKAVPPKNFEENTTAILDIVKEKVQKLMRAHHQQWGTYRAIADHRLAEQINQYCKEYLDVARWEEPVAELGEEVVKKDKQAESPRDYVNIPSRSYIKGLSSKLMEENVKSED